MTEHNRYLTAADVEDELPFDRRSFGLTSDEWSNVLERQLGAASDDIEKWADTVYNTATLEETMSRPESVPGHDLPLPKRPIQSVSSVEDDGTTLTEGDDYVVHDTHLELLDGAQITSWSSSRRSITVNWTYGFGEVPAAIEEAIIRLVRASLDRIKTDGLESESLPGGSSYSYRVPSEIEREVRSKVDDYSAPSYFGGTMVV